MYRDWFAMEHYRLHAIERWPESPARQAGLAAVHSTLESLARTQPASEPQFACIECTGGRPGAKLFAFPERTPALPLRKAA